MTLLHLAAELGLIDHIEVLLAFDVDVNIESKVSTLICYNFFLQDSRNANFFLSLRILKLE